MNAMLVSSSAGFGDGVVGLLLFAAVALFCLVWIFFPFILFSRLAEMQKTMLKSKDEAAALRVALNAINNNLVAYGQSIEARLDHLAAGQQKTPGHSSTGVRYEIGGE